VARPRLWLDRVALADARELTLVSVREDLPASLGTRPVLGRLLGVRLGVVCRNDVSSLASRSSVYSE
jgi:hypothetical protein